MKLKTVVKIYETKTGSLKRTDKVVSSGARMAKIKK